MVMMVDMNEYISTKGNLHDFCLEHDLIDSVRLLNPTLTSDPTYLYKKND